MTSSNGVDALFKYRHFDRQIIMLRVRRYVSCKLGYRNFAWTMCGRHHGKPLGRQVYSRPVGMRSFRLPNCP